MELEDIAKLKSECCPPSPPQPPQLWLGRVPDDPLPTVILLRLEEAIDAVELPRDDEGVTKPGR